MTPTSSELCYLTISQAAPLLRERQLSPVELTEAFLQRIAAVDGQLRAFVTFLPERALDQADPERRESCECGKTSCEFRHRPREFSVSSRC